MENEIEIRRAKLEDLNSLHHLHSFWIDKKQIKQVFSPEQLNKIILESDVAVAVHNSKVVSYYLLNPFFETGNVAQRKEIIKKLIGDGVLKEGRYAYSLQAGTDPDYTGRGLNRKVLNLLRAFTKDRYEYFIGIMPYGNEATEKSSLKMGWKHFGDVGIGILAVIATKDENNEHERVG